MLSWSISLARFKTFIVFRGVEINDKHIEIIIRQMLRKVRITDPGDTQFLWGDQIEKTTFEAINADITEQGGKLLKVNRCS